MAEAGAPMLDKSEIAPATEGNALDDDGQGVAPEPTQGGASKLFTPRLAHQSSRDTSVGFGLHEFHCYVPDLVLRVFPGRKTFVNMPNVQEMEAALLFADVSGFTPLTKTLQELKGAIRGGAPQRPEATPPKACGMTPPRVPQPRTSTGSCPTTLTS